MMCIQAFYLIIISSLNLEINTDIIEFFGQTVTLIILLYIAMKIPLYRLLNKIEKELLLKLLIYVLSGIVLPVLFYFRFDYTSENVIYFSILILMAFSGLYNTLKGIFFYTNKVPMQLHDIKNILIGLSISVQHSSDIEVVRKEIEGALDLINVDMDMKKVYTDDYNQNIQHFIEEKKAKAGSRSKLMTDIAYSESNQKVAFSTTLYMLGVLLDNALETGTRKPIFIKVSVIEESLYISVANEYEKKADTDFNKMFQERYSTKGETNSRGYGLSNLSNVVKKYEGEILVKEEYLEEQECNYLRIAIHI